MKTLILAIVPTIIWVFVTLKVLIYQRKKIEEEIDSIIQSRYNSYKGALFSDLKGIHENMRRHLSPKQFLAFLREVEKRNPKPVYKQP